MRETRTRWYAHVIRAKDDTVFKIGLNLEVPGKRPKTAQRTSEATLARYVPCRRPPVQLLSRVGFLGSKSLFANLLLAGTRSQSAVPP
ncbi:unnamed protein product [Heligmosomoides polygyrus]|uniref:Transposase n=1 Tax=Heligmosomoides polygyrus TaxID=6339 RepID=A0A183FPY9_HELPZ|nr:unnamed protein product [Heligmosomoides polygyrus]